MGALKEFIWPIEKSELKKFLPMSLMLFFTLYNYNALRSFKDSLVVPNIGAEAISFIWCKNYRVH
jgi:ATP/ADP translocase